MKRGTNPGYGIYATNKRIIGVKYSFGAMHHAPEGSLLSSAEGVVIVPPRGDWPVFLPCEQKLTKKQGAKIIVWLDSNKKDFEFGREQVSQIEIKNGGLWHRGYLKITSSSGEEVQVLLAGAPIEFEITKNLMQAFMPQAVKLIDY